MPLGTIVNVLAVLLGSAAGLLVRRALPDKVRQIVFQGIGLFTVFYGVQMALKLEPGVTHALALIFSLLIGGVAGELLDLQARLEALGDRFKARVRNAGERFTEGMVTAFLIFCVGPMTIVGALDDGLRGDHALLFTKSTLDGFMSIALASTYGLGVPFAAVPLFIFQYAITLLGLGARQVFTDVMVHQLTAVGGVLILGLGLNLLDVAKLRLTNLLPALLVVALLTVLLG